MSLPVLIVGGGGHAKVLIDVLRLCSVEILGIVDTDPSKIGNDILGIRVVGDDDVILQYQTNSLHLVNGMGSVHLPIKRRVVFEKFKKNGFTFATVIHPSAVIAADAFLDEGTQVMAGAVVQPGSRIGVDTIVNTKASVDHDCRIGNHVHLSPGVTLSGNVQVGDVSHLGTGANVIQGMTIGRNCFIGAGSLVIGNVPDDVEFMGVPARKR